MRIAKIDEYPELKDTLAELLADNVSKQDIADKMGVKDRGTIAEWAKRPEIQTRVSRLIEERSNRILTKTTEKIEGYLNSGSKISLENLLKIHREFAGQKLNIETGADAAKALQELFLQAHDDAELAAAMAKLGIDAREDEAADVDITA
jgi:hypothetical protein